jgi:hypothetical protein
MARLLIVVAVIALLLVVVGTSPAAPIPEGAGRPAFYHPTAVGTRWVYHRKRVIGSEDDTEVITAVKWLGQEAFVSVAVESDGRVIPLRTVRVSADGVFTVARSDGSKVDPPRPWLKAPLRSGATWELADADIQMRSTVRGREEVEVPAGKYQAMRVDSTVRLKGEVIRMTEWYAPGVGEVKQVIDGQSTEVLKSFTPGKD